MVWATVRRTGDGPSLQLVAFCLENRLTASVSVVWATVRHRCNGPSALPVAFGSSDSPL